MRSTLLPCIALLAAAVSLYPSGPPAAHEHATRTHAPARHAHRAHRVDLYGVALRPDSAEAVSLSTLTQAKKYACPPCGCGSDGKEFDRPGTCPSCEMDLIEKTPDAAASAAEAQSVVVKSAYAVEPPPSQNVTAGYMIVENRGDAEVELVSAASEGAAAVELHAMEVGEGGMMRMRRVERIGVPARGSVELKPGGLHLMFIGLTREIKDGGELTLTLLFSNQTKKTVTMPVRKRPAD